MTDLELKQLAARIAPDVFRTDLSYPGFALVALGPRHTPRAFRALLVRLGEALEDEYQQRHRDTLRFVSLSRFDQQNPTRPHRDGGPDASILVLGYEPTEVRSRVSLLDYSRAAFERGQTPGEFLDCCNPAFGGDLELLRGYAVELTAFRPDHFQVLVVNNSNLPHDQRHRGMLGLLHHAVIDRPMPDRARPIDSVLLGVVEGGLTAQQVQAFIDEATAATA
jgi:hypothetical protein